MTQTTRTSSRRDFLGKVGLVGAGAVLASCNMTPVMAQKANQDVAILNFALNLEYLEAAFYLAAVGRLNELTALEPGNNSAISLPSGLNATTPGNPIGLDPVSLAFAQEVANDELNHVKFLRAALGSNAVPRPVLDLNASFAAAGAAAGLPSGVTFNPYANPVFFLHGAFVFEDVGVTAYKGAARLIFDDSANGYLEQAAGILAVEAYHAGTVRTLLYQIKDTQPLAPGSTLTVAQIVQAISNLRDAADGPDDLDQGVVSGAGNPSYVGANGSSNLVPTDQNSVAFSRTVRQVLNIVYLDTTGSKNSGGFFPNGLNGTLR